MNWDTQNNQNGLPSLIHAGLHAKVCKDKNYYHFYTEHLFFDK